MQTQTPKILGIDIHSRQIGVSIFENTSLQHYAVISILGKSADETIQNAMNVFEDLIDSFMIDQVAFEKIVFVQQHRTFGKFVYDELIDLIKKREIPFREYNPKFVRSRICGDEKPTKANTMLAITHKYPELSRYFLRPKAWQHRYYSLYANAVAVGLVCALELIEGGPDGR